MAASICYGGTANKFCERLQGLSSLIQFIFINENTINLNIRQSVINQVLRHCQGLLDKAKQGSKEEKTAFCILINKLMDPNTASDVFETVFNTTNIEQQLKVEFKLYQILNGVQKLEDEISQFKEYSLPYLPPIDPQNTTQSFYHSFLRRI